MRGENNDLQIEKKKNSGCKIFKGTKKSFNFNYYQLNIFLRNYYTIGFYIPLIHEMNLNPNKVSQKRCFHD